MGVTLKGLNFGVYIVNPLKNLRLEKAAWSFSIFLDIFHRVLRVRFISLV